VGAAVDGLFRRRRWLGSMGAWSWATRGHDRSWATPLASIQRRSIFASISRIVRPFRVVCANHVADWFELERTVPTSCSVVADVLERRRRPMEADEKLLSALINSMSRARKSSGHPRRLLCARSDRPQGDQPAIPCAPVEFHARTGGPSACQYRFNVRSEPIVCPGDAFRCFMGTESRCWVAGQLLMRREDRIRHAPEYKDRFGTR